MTDCIRGDTISSQSDTSVDQIREILTFACLLGMPVMGVKMLTLLGRGSVTEECVWQERYREYPLDWRREIVAQRERGG